MVKTNNNNETIVSMSIRFGTTQLLALIQEEVDKAVAQSRDDLRRHQETASSVEATLRDRCQKLEQSLVLTQSDLDLARSAPPPDDLVNAKDLFEKLQSSLSNAGFVVDSDNIIRLGPTLSTLASEVSGTEGEPIDPTAHSPPQNTISGVTDILLAAKRSSEVWKEKCSAAEKERDGLKAIIIQNDILLQSKISEIESLRKEAIPPKPSPESPRDKPPKSPLKRPIFDEPSNDSSDSDIPLAALSVKAPLKQGKSPSPVRQKPKSISTPSPVLAPAPTLLKSVEKIPVPGPARPTREIKPPTPISDSQPTKLPLPRAALTPASKPLLAARSGQTRRPQALESPVSDSHPPPNKSLLSSPDDKPLSTTALKVTKLALPTSGQSKPPTPLPSFKRVRTSSGGPPPKPQSSATPSAPTKSRSLTISTSCDGQAKSTPGSDGQPSKRIRMLQTGQSSSAATPAKTPSLTFPTQSPRPIVRTQLTLRKSTGGKAPRRNF